MLVWIQGERRIAWPLTLARASALSRVGCGAGAVGFLLQVRAFFASITDLRTSSQPSSCPSSSVKTIP